MVGCIVVAPDNWAIRICVTLARESLMSIALASERRLLAQDEFEPVVRSHYPLIEELSHQELVDLARWLRERQNRSRDIVRDRRRVARGKAASRGTASETASERGLFAKKQVFASALKRVNGRLERMRAATQRAEIGGAPAGVAWAQASRHPPSSAVRRNRRHRHFRESVRSSPQSPEGRPDRTCLASRPRRPGGT